MTCVCVYVLFFVCYVTHYDDKTMMIFVFLLSTLIMSLVYLFANSACKMCVVLYHCFAIHVHVVAVCDKSRVDQTWEEVDIIGVGLCSQIYAIPLIMGTTRKTLVIAKANPEYYI